MVQLVLSNPTLRVNNETIGFKPNSISFKLGKGEKSVKGVSEGEGSSDVAMSENIEDRVGMIKFSLFSDPVLIELFNVWASQDINIGNDVKIFDRRFNATLVRGIVVNDPDINSGVDAEFEVDFKGPILIEFK